jgi:hypothetical protein
VWKDVLIVGWFVGVAVMVLGFRTATRKSGRRIADSQGTYSGQSYVGSVRWTRRRGFGGGNWTGQVATLSVFDWGVRLSPSAFPLRAFIPTVEIRFSEIDSARAMTTRMATSEGVEIRSRQADYYLVFWTTHGAAILEALRVHGVAVDCTLTPFPVLTWPDR